MLRSMDAIVSLGALKATTQCAQHSVKQHNELVQLEAQNVRTQRRNRDNSWCH